MKQSKEREDFSKYGRTFQESLAKLILEDRPFSDQIEEVLDTSFFELRYLRVFINLIFNYKRKYHVHPAPSILATLIRTEMQDENQVTQKQVRDFFARISNCPVEGEKFIKDTSLDFCKKQKLKEAILKSVNLLQSCSFEEIHSLIDDALKLGLDNNFGHDYKKDFEARYQLKTRNAVSTSWELIDELTKGGLGSGELAVAIAPTGAGKSMVLVHLGTAALKQGKNVVHYTLEMGDNVVGLRYDSCMTGVPIKDLHTYKERIYESCIDVEGELVIKEYPTKTASVNTIRAHLEKLTNRDFEIDMIIVDYADLLRPVKGFQEKRTELESIYEDLRAIAQIYNCPVVTASQTNRGGLEKEVITMESISEAFNKCFVADFIFSLSRTTEDKNNNTGRIFIAKNRNGYDGGIFPIFMDPSSVTIKVLEKSGETMGELEQSAMVRQKERLSKKYEKYRNNLKEQKNGQSE